MAGRPESSSRALVSVTPDGSALPVEKVIGASPSAVTENVPALFSVNVVELPLVNTAPWAPTVRVKAWVVVLAFPSVAVMVSG